VEVAQLPGRETKDQMALIQFFLQSLLLEEVLVVIMEVLTPFIRVIVVVLAVEGLDLDRAVLVIHHLSALPKEIMALQMMVMVAELVEVPAPQELQLPE
tara:strand:- start:209 stop:505 length:297 start_codon:yes stop_codon:yes gene_type:complete